MEKKSRKLNLQRRPLHSVRFSVDTKACTVQSRNIPYIVGYSWDKCGRIKELRIRHLARKFLKIWTQNTFGRKLPHAAKCHYDSVLLRKTFQGWKEECWVSGRGWSLSVRAEYHYRYYLLYMTFRRWQTFMSLQMEKKSKIQKAQEFDDRRRMRHIWDKWELFIQMSRRKSRARQLAEEQHRRTSLLSLWRLWKMRLQQHRNICTMEDQALTHRAMNLHSRVKMKIHHFSACHASPDAFLQWKELHSAACSEIEKQSEASLHLSSTVTKKSLHEWQSFVSCQQHKKPLKAVAKHVACLHLMRLSWRVWRSEWHRKQSKEERLQATGQLTGRVSQREALLRWKAYVTWRKQKADRGQVACQRHHHRLQRAVLKGLSLNVSQNRVKRLNNNTAVQHHYRTVINKHWRLWKERLEETDDKPFQALTDMVLTNYRTHLLSRCFDHWSEKLAQQRHMQELEWRADVWFDEHLLAHYFNSWCKYILQRRLKKDRRDKADVYNKQRLCTWVLCTWRERSDKHKDEMLSLRIAILHEEQGRVQRAWARWRKRTKQLQEKQQASEHHYPHFPHTSLEQRKDTSELQARTNEQQACRQDDLYCVRWALDRWKKFVQRQKLTKSRLEQVQCCHENKIDKHSFEPWKLQYSLKTFEPTERALWHWALTLQAKVLYGWSLWVIKKRRKKMEALEAAQVDKIQSLKVFLAWREETKHAVSDPHQKRKALNRPQSSLNQVELLQRERISPEKARKHYDSKLLCKVLRAWKTHHHSCLKYKLQSKLKVSEQTEEALWHWALTLQAKVLYAWRLWASEQRRKRTEAVEAAQVVKDRPQSAGATCIVTYGEDMNDIRGSLPELGTQREEEPACLQWEEKQKLHIQKVVKCCAMRWKQRALCKPPKKTVTFCYPDLKPDSLSDSGERDGDDSELIRPLMRRQPRRCEELFEPSPKVLPYDGGDVRHVSPQKTPVSITDPPQTQCEVLLPPTAFMSTENKVPLGRGSIFSPTMGPSSEHFSSTPSDVHAREPSGESPASSLISELMSIQQDMRSFQQDRKQLRLWQRVKDVLQSWLQTSGKDEEMDTSAVCQQVKELEERIERLSCELGTRRLTMRFHSERLQHLQAVLDCSGFSSLYRQVQM
ncbi:protein SFI1 homolog isoform X1 [Phyllopteryx taeniolatus]|uniref:protein SFI1 homolog isoform X1 n=2 Tax=Phyllopteryx taeniolatus TaxID=161469 RepID=UPI002AD3E272|nr:protein SFI1 homolog isoform X1 [Phyllopteryx taeniolatus]XP_061639426.1 protein SFI1 homolog isoform X1 [Phyllopteryx taeniolatus]